MDEEVEICKETSTMDIIKDNWQPVATTRTVKQSRRVRAENGWEKNYFDEASNMCDLLPFEKLCE